MFLDEQFKYYSGSVEQVGSNEEFKTHIFNNIPINKSGYLYIYVSNETPNIDVFFDNLQVTHTRGPLVEETHYYPFGLTMAGLSSKALAFGNPNNRKGYVGNEIQNKEFIDGSGLDFYDFNARTYDQQIGRFIQIDPLSEEADQEGWSPFHYSYDNPVTYSDPDGKCPCLIIPVVQAITAAVVAGTTTYVVVKSYENSDLDLNLSLPAATGTGTARPAMTSSAAQLDFAVERQLNTVSKNFARNSTSQGALKGGIGTQVGMALTKSSDKKPDGTQGVQNGVIYEVPGTHTKSGKPYIGRTKNPDPTQRRSDGGRDRKKAKVVDKYNPDNVHEGRVKEQKKIDEKGLENLDNKRNEIKQKKAGS